MDGKVLIFVKDYQLNRLILNCVNQLKLNFFECFREEDIYFKIKLCEDPNKLFVYEFLHEKEEEQFELLQKISDKGFKILVIFPEYSISYIDRGQKVGVDDMLVYPIETSTLTNKITSLLNLPIENQISEVIFKEVTDDYMESVTNEIIRARRGNYDLSFVMFSFVSVAEEKLEEYFNQLKIFLRETDILLPKIEKNKFILMCPFTKKNYLVEVENKIRETFNQLKQSGTFLLHSKIYMHGLTLDVDGRSFEELFKQMVEGIEVSKQYDQQSSKKLLYKRNNLNMEKLKAYRTTNR